MKRIITYFMALSLLLGAGLTSVSAQVNYISPFTGNDGNDPNNLNNLFANCLPEGSDIYIDWNVFVDAALCGTGSAGAGQGSDCKVVVRGMTPTADGSSVIASDVVCQVTGTYNGENGNNDIYFANLNVCGQELVEQKMDWKNFQLMAMVQVAGAQVMIFVELAHHSWIISRLAMLIFIVLWWC